MDERLQYLQAMMEAQELKQKLDSVGAPPEGTPCTCADGRTFGPGDTVIFHAEWENNSIRTGKLILVRGCQAGVINYPWYYATASGRIKNSGTTRQQIQQDLCRLMKPMPRSAITKALTVDSAKRDGVMPVQKNGLGDESQANEQSSQRPPESGNLLAGQNLGGGNAGGLPGGFHIGECVFVPKEMHVHGRHVPKETMGQIIGTGGKHGEKLRVAFVEFSKGRFITGLLLGMAIGPMTNYVPYANSPRRIVVVLISPDDLWGIWAPAFF